MAAYPAHNVTYRQFAALLESSKLASIERIEDLFDEGNAALYRFIRVIPTRTIDIIQYVEDDLWPMMPTTLRSLCARLDIDPTLIIGTRH